MAMIKCKECKKEISSKAEQCPHCGAKNSKSFFKPSGCGAWLAIILIGLIFLSIVVGKIATLFSPDVTQKSTISKPTKTSNIKFVQVGYNKTKLMNGAYSRVFSVYTPKIDYAAMKNHARSKMYTQGGSTSVFFFNDRDNTPNVTATGAEYPPEYDKYLVAAYWKYPDGKEKFDKDLLWKTE